MADQPIEMSSTDPALPPRPAGEDCEDQEEEEDDQVTTKKAELRGEAAKEAEQLGALARGGAGDDDDDDGGGQMDATTSANLLSRLQETETGKGRLAGGDLGKVTVEDADVDTLCKEFDMTPAAAELYLRRHGGALEKAARALVFEFPELEAWCRKHA
eukprot:GHVU01024958.1.p1 GENE.GHVU01024958.1~~GHVU01024958.1.p1  ORF type:complete len:158 (-),score=38.82 GHVU01024958.1:84-557(-)